VRNADYASLQQKLPGTKVTLLQNLKLDPLVFYKVIFVVKKHLTHSLKTIIAFCRQFSVFPGTHLVNRLVEVLADIKFKTSRTCR